MTPDLARFLEGLAAGFLIAAPVGPMAALCVQRTLARGLLLGLSTGVGAALADALFGALAALGTSVVSELLLAHRALVQRVGGVILLVLGARMLAARATELGARDTPAGRVAAAASAFVLTLTNPMTFVAFAAVFTGIEVGQTATTPASMGALVSGVLVGSWAWWTILCATAHALRGRLDARSLGVVNRVTGVIVVVVGLVYLVVAPG